MNVRFAQIRRSVRGKALAVGAALTVPVLAMAQATDPFLQAATDVKEKVGTYGGELVVIAAVGVIFMIGIKYVKKIRSAA